MQASKGCGESRYRQIVDALPSTTYHRWAMRKALIALVSVLSLTVSALAANGPDIRVYFSPNGGCTDEIVKQIGRAKSNLLMQAYSLTSKPIAEAMVNTKKRGVDVEAILKRGYTGADFLSNAGVRTLVDAKHIVAHDKIMILDGGKIQRGKSAHHQGQGHCRKVFAQLAIT
jgi:phosphatidylserine/phosphatidylglycerophosphate/cardiolipin synthase-like enzyme